MIKNLPTDIEKKIDHIYISLPFNSLSTENYLKNELPSNSIIEQMGKALKIRVIPGDGSLNLKQNDNKSGIFWNFNLSLDVLENEIVNQQKLNRFTNRKIVVFLATTTHLVQVGNMDQPLDFSFNETITGFNISISGKNYFPAARKKITSFRATGV